MWGGSELEGRHNCKVWNGSVLVWNGSVLQSRRNGKVWNGRVPDH